MTDNPDRVSDIVSAVRAAVREELDRDKPFVVRNGMSYLTTEDVTRLLSISKTTLWQLRRDGKIPAYSVGRRVLFRADDVTALVERNGQNPTCKPPNTYNAETPAAERAGRG